MRASKTILLMTRPVAASERFVAELSADARRSLTLCLSPLIRIVPVATEVDVAGMGGLIFTSRNAVDIAADLNVSRALPVFCVGAATTRAATGAGWAALQLGETAEDFLSAAQEMHLPGPLMHLSGRQQRGDIAETLTARGVRTVRKVLYEQCPVELTVEARAQFQGAGPILAPVFSPQTARHFARLTLGHDLLHLVAISEAAAKPLKPLRFRSIRVAAAPTRAAMLEMVEEMALGACRVEASGPRQ